MTTTVSTSVADIGLSAIKDMAIRAARHPGAVSLAWGLPSFATPEAVRRAVVRALGDDPDIGKYSLPDGVAGLRSAIAGYHAGRSGRSVDPDRDIVVSAGNMQGVSVLLRTLLNPGDEVVVTDPGFVSHLQQIHLCHARPVSWKLDENNGWRLDVDVLEPLIGPRTRAIILVSPSNPTGTAFDRESLMETARIAQRHGIPLLLDDPYSGFRYRGSEHWFDLTACRDYDDTLVYLFTFSKVHAMSGYRLGYMVLPEGLKPQALKVHDANIICAPRISQVAGLAALADGSPHIARFTDLLEARRDAMCERIDRVSHVFDYVRPDGAYYVFPRILADHIDSRSFAVELLQQTGVSVTPGSAFGPSGEYHVRMAFCIEEEVIHEAFDRIEKRFGSSDP